MKKKQNSFADRDKVPSQAEELTERGRQQNERSKRNQEGGDKIPTNR